MKRLGLAVVLLLGVACSRKEPEKPKEKEPEQAGAHADEPKHDELPRRVRLTKEVIAAAKIKDAPVGREMLAQTLLLPGEVVSDPDRSARVSAPVAGRLVQVLLREGAVVKKGDLLATVRVTEAAKVRSQQSGATAKAAAAKANAERLETLAAKGLAAKQEAVSARAEADALAAESRGLGEELGVLGLGGSGSDIAIHAPLGGTVVMRDAVVGQPVTSDQPIATISDLSDLWFLGRVFEKDLGKLNVGAKAEVVMNAHPKERFEGSVEYIGKQLDPTARTVTARIVLRNREDLLRIGLFGNARVSMLDAHPKAAVMVVPTDAVTEIGGKTVVFVRQADDDFELHEVVTGESSLGKTEIASGLREGENVVFDGVFTLKSAVLKGTLAED